MLEVENIFSEQDITQYLVKNVRKDPTLKRVKWNCCFGFETFGVKIGIRSNNLELLERIKLGLPDLLPVEIKQLDFAQTEYHFSIYKPRQERRKFYIKKETEDESPIRIDNDSFDALDSKIRLTVAEFAKDFIFLHAGAVGYQGKAIIIPARSFSGKTTLVAELAKRGMEYYSDEYAVIDPNGFVHPFAKKLSMRGIISDYEQVDIAVEEMGGTKGQRPIKVGLILVSKFKKNSKFKPKLISSGEGIIESIANSVSIRQNPKLVLDVLSQITSSAKILKMNRDEAAIFADQFIPYLEKIGY